MSAEQLIRELHDCGVKLAIDGDDLVVDAPDGALDAAMLDRLKQFKMAIVNRLASLPQSTSTIVLPASGQRKLAYQAPASSAQKRMMILEAIAGDVSYYNIPLAYRIRGDLQVDALKHAFRDLITKHDVLRTIYVQDGEDYVQQVCLPDEACFEVVDLTTCAATDDAVASILQGVSNQRFDLSSERPIRVTLTCFADREFLLSMMVHHICADGWSAKILVDDIQSAYTQYLDGVPIGEKVASRTGLQYADYTAWHEEWMASENAGRAREYWVDALAGAPSIHCFPTDFTRSAEQNVAGDWYTEALPAGVQSAVETYAQERKLSSFTIFQTAFAALIHRYSTEDDFVFGTAAANRFPAAFSRTIGLFVNTLPIRCQTNEAMNFNALTDEIVRVSRQGLVHQAFPFDAIVDAIQPDRGLSHNPLVQLMIVMQDDDTQALSLMGLSTSPVRTRQNVSKFDLTLHIHYSLRGINLHWEFNTGLFLAESIKTISRSYIELLAACVTQPTMIVDEFPLAFGSVPATYDSGAVVEPPQCVHSLIRSAALQCPDAIAASDDTQNLTYAELERKAGALAESIVRHVGDCLRRPVAVYADRSFELVIAMYAIFKLGATYVPLDPYHPPERVKFMMEDVGANVLLLGRNLPVQPPSTESCIVHLEIDKECEGDATRQDLVDDPTLPLYVIYTSGTTGHPKGVVVSNKALFHSLRANTAAMEFTHTDTIPTIGSQAFGVSLLEILLPLTTGGTVRIVRKAQINDLEALVASTNDVTVLHAVPSLMRQWLDFVSVMPAMAMYRNLRLLLVGGEPV
ncbi:MAG TPA: condensation domain-containing protein, partial [Burkholderiaceae bacterium]|nr:condensation domain-containing protein [Burkholderiaceae bacterium]